MSYAQLTQEQLNKIKSSLVGKGHNADIVDRSIESGASDTTNIIENLQGQFPDDVIDGLFAAGRQDIIDQLRPNNVASLGNTIDRVPGSTLFKDLSYEFRSIIADMLGVENPDRLDYRKMANDLGITEARISLLGEIPLKRGEQVLEVWKQQNGHGATLRSLADLTKRLGMMDITDKLTSKML